ncbi:hypothetical protein L1987_69980 [Smallanthus sonchifolius]|uniref:Uncharacterized protein n=1 Tax=Smallanthus sonchifolius TaxID=185202 RepID=A0ACB9B7D8_9ASTR|nr:hypothetical protein L1987_69980 [Smallanthus sonchifolius]
MGSCLAGRKLGFVGVLPLQLTLIPSSSRRTGVSQWHNSKLDPELIERKLNAMRILQNVDLPSSIVGLLTKPKEMAAIDVSKVRKVSDKCSLADEENEFVGNKDKKVALQP